MPPTPASFSTSPSASKPRRTLLAFYALAWLIVIGVMAAFFALTARDPAAASLMDDLYKYIVAGGGYTGVIPIARFAADHPAAWLVLLFAAAPSIAALCVALASGGLGPLLARLKPWLGVDAAQGRRVYRWLFGIHFAVIALSLVAVRQLAGDAALAGVAQALGGSAFFIAGVVLFGAFGDEGGLLEELGWRGFAMPLLQQMLASPLAAAVLLGVMWWAWHLPRELPALLGSGMSGTWVFNQSVFVVLCVALSIIIAWAVNLTGGSVLPAILIHGGTNVWSKIVQPPLYDVFGFSLRDLSMVLAAMAVLWLAGPRLGKAVSR